MRVTWNTLFRMAELKEPLTCDFFGVTPNIAHCFSLIRCIEHRKNTEVICRMTCVFRSENTSTYWTYLDNFHQHLVNRPGHVYGSFPGRTARQFLTSPKWSGNRKCQRKQQSTSWPSPCRVCHYPLGTISCQLYTRHPPHVRSYRNHQSMSIYETFNPTNSIMTRFTHVPTTMVRFGFPACGYKYREAASERLPVTGSTYLCLMEG